MFFVLSAGRSGSRTAAAVFSQYENCVCLHHPKPELVTEATEYFYGESNGAEIARTLRETRRPVVDGAQYGEANLQLSLLIPVLREVFPEAKYVWLVRDGRDAVASMYYRGWYDPSQTRVPKHWHDARLQAHRVGDMTSGEWSEYSRFEKCCWIWKKYNLAIESQLAFLAPDRWRQVRLEEFRARLPDLEAFLGLRRLRRILVQKRNVAVQPVISWKAWSMNRRSSFERICGAEMDRWARGWRGPGGNGLS